MSYFKGLDYSMREEAPEEPEEREFSNEELAEYERREMLAMEAYEKEPMKTVTVVYELNSRVEITYAENGETVGLFIGGKDRTGNGEAEAHIVARLAELKIDHQARINEAWDRLYNSLYSTEVSA